MFMLLPCLPKAPDGSNKMLNGQQLGRGGISGAGGQREKGSQPASKGPSQSWARQTDLEEPGKQDGQYIDKVNKLWGSAQMNRNGLV